MIIIILIVTLSAKLLPLHLRKENCGVHPYFSVGKRRSLSSNHLTIATHQLCKACCIHEQLFKEIPIEIERIELDRNPSFIEKYNVKRFPYLRFQNHTYNDILNLNQILKFLQPYKLVGISSLLELERFLYSQQEMQDTKIIGIFHGIGEYKSEIKWFTEWCMKNYNYRYQFGMMTNSKEVKKIQEKYKNYNQILISRFAGDLEFVEHIEQPPILLIDELKFENSRRYLSTGKPILLIVLDSIVLYEDSFEYLVEFQKLASVQKLDIYQKFNNQIYVTWMDGNLNEDRLQMLGIEVFQQIPIITFFEIDSSYKIIYDGNIFNQTEISQFIEDYLRYPRDVMFQRYKRIQNTLLDNTLIIRSDNKTLIQQIKWNVKKFGNAMNIQKEQSNQTQLIYFKNNQKYYLPSQIHEALKQIQTINSEVTFPTINLEVPENKLIDYFMRQLFNVTSIIFLFTIIIITGNIPIRSKTFNQNKALAAISSAFSGGLFIAVCLLHLLPESCDKFRAYFIQITDKEVFPYPFLITLSTFALILFIEKIFTNHKHSHEDHYDLPIEPQLIKDSSLCCSKQQDACCNQVESQLQEEALRKAVSTTMKLAQRVSFFQKRIPKPERNSLTPILLQIAVGIHAMFEGLAIGIETNVSRCLGIALAVMCHKWAEGLTLGVAFKKAKVPRKTAQIMIFIQAIMNPIGVSIGWILSNDGDLVTGIFYAISAGTFLYISTIEVIVEEFNMARYKCAKFSAFMLAIGFVCGIWFIEQLQLLQ